MSFCSDLRFRLLSGLVIPAHPLALTEDGRIDERRQRGLTRYYLAAGAGGLAVGVHTTQFGIHAGDGGLYRAALELAAEEIDGHEVRAAESGGAQRIVRIAGIVGDTPHPRREAELAAGIGYECGLLSLAALREASNDELIRHCEAVSERIPVFGFYLQEAVGGRPLDRAFWRRFCSLERAVAVKVAPFDRHRTMDVFHGLAESGRGAEVALYTGNDDAIVRDLLLTVHIGGRDYRFAGGLLGQWAVWTRRAVELFERIREARFLSAVPDDILRTAGALTEANAAIFDAAHGFTGCIPGIHEILRRHGLLRAVRCLDPAETLSPGQREAIDRVWHRFPWLRDDDFIDAHRTKWITA